MPSTGPIRVAIVAYDGVSLLDLSGPLEALRVASTHPNHVGASLIYACSVHSVHGGPIMTGDRRAYPDRTDQRPGRSHDRYAHRSWRLQR